MWQRHQALSRASSRQVLYTQERLTSHTRWSKPQASESVGLDMEGGLISWLSPGASDTCSMWGHFREPIVEEEKEASQT